MLSIENDEELKSDSILHAIVCICGRLRYARYQLFIPPQALSREPVFIPSS